MKDTPSRLFDGVSGSHSVMGRRLDPTGFFENRHARASFKGAKWADGGFCTGSTGCVIGEKGPTAAVAASSTPSLLFGCSLIRLRKAGNAWGQVSCWPEASMRLGFQADGRFRDIIRIHIEGELGGKSA
jgi:hypothetical protein